MEVSLSEKELCNVLGLKSLFVEFQPIFCIGSRKIIGVEALLRGLSLNGTTIYPYTLFNIAQNKGLRLELDVFARKKAFKEFKEKFLKYKDLILFFNFDASILDLPGEYSWKIHSLAQEVGLPPEKIVIEVIETKVKNFKALKSFVEFYKSKGFLIALDDVGIEYSNLSRIPPLKPDFLKIDKELIYGIERDEYKSKLIKALANLAKEIGSFTIAEGVEKEIEILTTLELGINFHQGFLLGKPFSAEQVTISKLCKEMEILKNKFSSYFKLQVLRKKKLYNKFKNFIEEFSKKLSKVENFSKLENELKKVLHSYKFIHGCYVVDMKGCLLTDIILHTHTHTHTHTQITDIL